MVAEMVAIISLGVSTLGSLWKLYHHLDQRLDLLLNNLTSAPE